PREPGARLGRPRGGTVKRGAGRAGKGTAASSRRRLRVGVVYGGRSVEHEGSLVSARAIMQALDPPRYRVVPSGIPRRGRWVLEDAHCVLPPDPSVRGLVRLKNGAGGGETGGLEAGGAIGARPAALAGRPASNARRPGGRLAAGKRTGADPGRLDVIFPVVHGTGGEDGALQGLLELADIPYVGAGVLGSALGMDKAMMKVVFRDAGLPIVEHRVFLSRDLERGAERLVHSIEEAFGYPCFIKPANG